MTHGDGDTVPGSKIVIRSPLQGMVVGTPVAVGETVAMGAPVVILESMKMEHEVGAPAGGTVVSLEVVPGAAVTAGTPLCVIESASLPGPAPDAPTAVDLEAVRADLAELHRRQAAVLDSGRPDVVARRHARGRRTARENIDDLCDPGSFTEYGSLAIAAQRGRRPREELIERTPADGLVAGIGRVNGDRFEAGASSCAVALLRLHRAGRNPGPAEPSQEGPRLRAHGTVAAPRNSLRRRWRRPAGRHGLRGDHRPRHQGVRQVRRR